MKGWRIDGRKTVGSWQQVTDHTGLGTDRDRDRDRARKEKDSRQWVASGKQRVGRKITLTEILVPAA